jgi:hypothetical protein
VASAEVSKHTSYPILNVGDTTRLATIINPQRSDNMKAHKLPSISCLKPQLDVSLTNFFEKALENQNVENINQKFNEAMQ